MVETHGASTAAISLSLERDAQLLSIRVSSAEPVDARLAFTLEDVRVGQDDTWVQSASVADFGEFCAHCRERISAGVGYGLFDLPSSARALSPIESVSLRVALRDCTTWLPFEDARHAPALVRVEWLGRKAPVADARLHLGLAVALASAHGFAGGAADTLLTDALTVVRTIWLQAGIDLEISAPATLDPVAAVHFAPDERAALTDLTRRARAALPGAGAWLVLTPCITFDDPLADTQVSVQGRTTHLPGGLGVGQEPDGMFVAVERCVGSRSQPAYAAGESAVLGAVIAHELGHFLGLYHVRELDGTDDQLPDTSASEPNLMQVRPASTAVLLTADQIRVARRHPYLTPQP